MLLGKEVLLKSLRFCNQEYLDLRVYWYQKLSILFKRSGLYGKQRMFYLCHMERGKKGGRLFDRGWSFH